MADFWIKVEKGTPDKPEILELAGILDITDPDTITGKMIRVWSWFDSNSENGHAPSVTSVLIDRLTGVTGFTDALVTVGWLNKTESGFSIPNFDRHLGKGAKKRASDAERKRKSRAKSQDSHTESVTEKGLDKSREDKSREDKSREDNKDIPSPPAKAGNDVLEIFNYWKEVMKKNGSAKLTKERDKKIKLRLKEGYTVEQIKQAIYGCSVTPHNMGQNENGKKYDDIELICRTGSNVERFMSNAESQSGTTQQSRKLNAVEENNQRLLEKYGDTSAPGEREINPTFHSGMDQYQVPGGIPPQMESQGITVDMDSGNFCNDSDPNQGGSI